MAKYIDEKYILSLGEINKIILEEDDTITDSAFNLAKEKCIDVLRLTKVMNVLTERVVVTVVGIDKTGIISSVTGICAEYDVNILDISQTVLHGDFFTMAMVVDIKASSITLESFREKLLILGTEKNLKINIQHEDLFNFMHRI